MTSPLGTALRFRNLDLPLSIALLGNFSGYRRPTPGRSYKYAVHSGVDGIRAVFREIAPTCERAGATDSDVRRVANIQELESGALDPEIANSVASWRIAAELAHANRRSAGIQLALIDFNKELLLADGQIASLEASLLDGSIRLDFRPITLLIAALVLDPGDRRDMELLSKLGELCRKLALPVIVSFCPSEDFSERLARGARPESYFSTPQFEHLRNIRKKAFAEFVYVAGGGVTGSGGRTLVASFLLAMAVLKAVEISGWTARAGTPMSPLPLVRSTDLIDQVLITNHVARATLDELATCGMNWPKPYRDAGLCQFVHAVPLSTVSDSQNFPLGERLLVCQMNQLISMFFRLSYASEGHNLNAHRAYEELGELLQGLTGTGDRKPLSKFDATVDYDESRRRIWGRIVVEPNYCGACSRTIALSLELRPRDLSSYASGN